MRVPRTRGAVSGLVIALLGIWAAVIPFVGPYFDYSIGTDQTWSWEANKLWLSVLPGAAAFIGGLMLMGSGRRSTGHVSSWLPLLAGLWLVCGQAASLLWQDGIGYGPALGSSSRQSIELLGYFFVPGAIITALSAFAMARFTRAAAVPDERAGREEGVVEERRVGKPEVTRRRRILSPRARR